MPRDLLPERSIILRSVLINPSKQRYLLVILVMLLANLACQIDIGGPDRPGEAILKDPAQATEVAQIWSQAITESLSAGQVVVIFNEIQITGFFANRLNTESSPLLQEPQIYLRDGQIQVYGIFERGILKSSVLMRVEPTIDIDGQLSLQVIEASVGPIPAPQLLMETISALVTEALTGSIGSLATGIKLSSLAIADGEMSIVGEIR